MTLEELYNKEQKHFVRTMYRYTRDLDLAEDVVQEAFCKALQSYDTYDPERAKLKTWFNSVMFSVLWKMKKKMPPAMLDIDAMLDSEELVSINEVSLKDYILNVKNETHKEILFAHFVLGYKLEETATCLGQTVANVKKVIHRFSFIGE